MANKRIDQPTGTETVGHEWDGIEELNTPLPRWWLWTFYLSILFAIGYVIVYPAIPMRHSGTQGMFGWTSRGQLAQEMSAADKAKQGVRERIAAMPLDQLPNNPALMQQAVAGGAAAFRVNCVQCHGPSAAGGNGYPNLNDDDWLWGGTLDDIHTTLMHGIRQPGDDQTRQSQMPAFAGILDAAQTSAVADHVLSLSGKAKDNPQGAQLFAQNCAVCHGAEGQGGRTVGAPRLNDAIWLYGSSKDAIERQIQKPRMGVMPAWTGRLDPVTIKMLAAYVHSLGGGEETPAVAPIGNAPTASAPAAPAKAAANAGK